MQDVLPSADHVLPRIRARDAALIQKTLLRDGVAIVSRAAAPRHIADIYRDLDPWFEAALHGEDLFLGRKTRRFSGVFVKAPRTADLARHELILELVEPLLKGPEGQFADAIQLHLTQAIAIDPGERAQILHRDDTAFPFAHDFELMLNVMWPLDAFTRTNGATCFVPGSHRWRRGVRPALEDALPAEASPGDAIIWLGSTFHGGGANRSDRPRHGLVFSYSLAWLAQAEKLLLSTPPEVARSLPEKLQRLIGYQVHKPNLGWIEERDPREWLLGEVRDLAPAQDHFPPDLKQLLEAALGGADGAS